MASVLRTAAQIAASKRNLQQARSKRHTALLGRTRDRQNFQEASIEAGYHVGATQPRRYESPQAVAQHGRHARVPVAQAIKEDVELSRMRLGNKLASQHAAIKSKERRIRQPNANGRVLLGSAYHTEVKPSPKYSRKKIGKG
jgi:hypothetical protein